ncbi:hypothetical protein ZHAS_00021413 [Anopheles sinensis]|uniref:Uncharacterized protein n=1 Tax=Anopheles sinensis TaxID=74873 RepID=A0A084WS89_ANOSI|nr:hypothetical protein ZHAS_00021413 [Anopheles sinensis]
MEYKHRPSSVGLFQYRIQYYRDYDEGTLQPADGSCIYLKELDHFRTKAKIPSDHARSNRKLPLCYPVTEIQPKANATAPTPSPAKER